MSYISSLDTVFKIVKNLVDYVRCPICDKPEGLRSRYSCGHTVCDECMTIEEGCVVCLTPPNNCTQNKLRLDNPLSERVKNAYNLLKACQDTFHTDVYERLRVSDQLKKEREVFPDCIQAPVKYYNKRKSLNTSFDKENKLPSIFPGEIISPSKQVKMKKHNSFIQQWLNENETSRRALSDLNVNDQSYNKKSANDKIISRKRIHSLSPVRIYGKRTFKNYVKNVQNENSIPLLGAKDQVNCENDESGIVLDDEPIYIEDSQSQIIDKDKLAFLAVEAAEKERRSSSNSLRSLENIHVIDSVQNNNLGGNSSFFKLDPTIVSRKVPFLKMCPLVETCSQCKGNYVDDKNTVTDDTKNLSISIDSKDFITTINISNCNTVLKNKSTVFVQTDIEDITSSSTYNNKEKDNIPNFLLNEDHAKSNIQLRSQDLFINDDKCGSEHHNLPLDQKIDGLKHYIPSKAVEQYPKKSNVVINDSDSDTITEPANILQVSADIHRSYDSEDYGILHKICIEKLASRSKRKRRGATPDSNNSSEKENCDPNKQKKKKFKIKKKNTKF